MMYVRCVALRCSFIWRIRYYVLRYGHPNDDSVQSSPGWMWRESWEEEGCDVIENKNSPGPSSLWRYHVRATLWSASYEHAYQRKGTPYRVTKTARYVHECRLQRRREGPRLGSSDEYMEREAIFGEIRHKQWLKELRLFLFFLAPSFEIQCKQ